MSARGATVSREAVREARARAAQPAPAPAPTAKEKPPRTPNAFKRWLDERQRGKPDWSFEGFDAACDKWLEEASKKEAWVIPEMCEWLAHHIANELNQKDVSVAWIAVDRATKRPHVKILMADRWVMYHDVSVTITKLP